MNTEIVKVSVIMPVYNAEDYLRPAIDSVLDSTLREIELICIDDGSTDRSLDIIKEYQKNDPRVRIITENNAGPSLARNKGLARSRGEYVIFLDADDFFEPTMLEKLYQLSEEKALDIAIAKYDLYSDKKSRFEPSIPSDHGEIFAGGTVVSQNEYPDYILQCTTGYVWNKLWRKSFLNEKQLQFDTELRVFEDTYFVVTALCLASRIAKVDEVLSHHRVYSDQSKNRLFKKYYAQLLVLYAKIKEFMRARGMYAPLSQSFLNLSTSRCYKIYNILWSDAKENFWNMLHSEYAEMLGWTQAKADDFETDEARDFCANVIMYTHDQYVKREKKGRRVRIARVAAAIKSFKNKKKIKQFFKKLFSWRKNDESDTL